MKKKLSTPESQIDVVPIISMVAWNKHGGWEIALVLIGAALGLNIVVGKATGIYLEYTWVGTADRNIM